MERYYSFYDTVNKANLLNFKEHCVTHYKPASANIQIFGLNQYLEYVGREDLKLRSVKVQQKRYLENVISNEDYEYLKKRMKKDGRMKWYFMVWFMTATGARISELLQIKVELVQYAFAENRVVDGKELEGKESVLVIHDRTYNPEHLLIKRYNPVLYGPLGEGEYTVWIHSDNTFSESFSPSIGNSIPKFSQSGISTTRWKQGYEYEGFEQRLNARLIEAVAENALISMGYPEAEVRADVSVMETDNLNFKGKFATFSNAETAKKYINLWDDADFSDAHLSNSAKQSDRIGDTRFSLKYYDGSKSSDAKNQLGFVKNGLSHYIEAIRAYINNKVNIGVENAKEVNDAFEK